MENMPIVNKFQDIIVVNIVIDVCTELWLIHNCVQNDDFEILLLRRMLFDRQLFSLCSSFSFEKDETRCLETRRNNNENGQWGIFQ